MAGLLKLIQTLAAVNRALALLFRLLAWTLLATMTAIVVLQVFFRKVLNDSLTWSEDVSLMMMLWVAFCVAPIAYRLGLNVALDTVLRFLAGRAVYLLYLLIHLLVLTMLAALLVEALELVGRSRIRANTVPVDMKYIYMIMPASFAAMMLAGVELAARCLLGLCRPAHPQARLPAERAENADELQQA